MIRYLEDLLSKLFGARDQIAIPVRVEDDEPRPGQQPKGRK